MSEPTPESTLNKQPRPLAARWVPLRPSRWLARAHLGVLLALSVLPLLSLLITRPTALHWWLLVVFEGLLLVEYWRFRRGSGRSPEAVACEEDGRWWLLWQEQWVEARAVGDSVVWSWLQVLRLKELQTDRRHSIVVLPDCAGRDDRRQLRVWMRLGRG